MIRRRTFLSGMFSALAAPAIVRAANLMPVKPIDDWRKAIGYLQTIPYDEIPMPIKPGMVYRVYQRLIYANPDVMPVAFGGFRIENCRDVPIWVNVRP